MPAGSSAALATGANTVRAGIVHRTSTNAMMVASAKRSIAGCCPATVPELGRTSSASARLGGAVATPLLRLPALPGALIGRAADVARVHERLLREDVRLLTLVGAAGTGKTRLA